MKESSSTRRQFLKKTTILAGLALSAACAPAPTAAPAAPAATAAPAAPAATAAPAAAAAKPATGALPDLKGKEITISYPRGEPQQLEEISKAYEAQTGLKFNRVVLPYGELYDKLLINLSQTTGAYDLTVLDDPWCPQFFSKGYVQPLDPFFEKAGLKGLDSDFVPRTVELSKWPAGTGKLMGIDYLGNTQMYAYRKDLLEKYGLQPPKTWDEVYAFASMVKQKEPGMYGFVMRGKAVNPAVSAYMPNFWGHGAEMFDDNYNPLFNSEQSLAALEFWVKLAKETAPPGVATFDSTEGTRSLFSGESAQAMVWPSWAAALDDPKQSQTAGKWGLGVAPAQPGGKGGSMMGNWLLAIPQGAKNADTAFQFMLFASGPEGQRIHALQGIPPTRASVFQDSEIIGKRPYFKNIYENLQVARYRPRITNWGAVENAFGTQISAALAGENSPKDALNTVQQEVLGLMKKEGYLK
jgi:multiple sugar transport system substrate-binding protein